MCTGQHAGNESNRICLYLCLQWRFNSFSFSSSVLNKHRLPFGRWVCLGQHSSLANLCSLFTEPPSLCYLDVSVSLLSLLVTTCGLALFSVSLFVSWKICWVPLSGRFLPDVLKGAHFLGGDQQPVLTEVRRRGSHSKVKILVKWDTLSFLYDSNCWKI